MAALSFMISQYTDGVSSESTEVYSPTSDPYSEMWAYVISLKLTALASSLTEVAVQDHKYLEELVVAYHVTRSLSLKHYYLYDKHVV